MRKLLAESLRAHMSGDTELAKTKFHDYIIGRARKINESIEAEVEFDFDSIDEDEVVDTGDSKTFVVSAELKDDIIEAAQDYEVEVGDVVETEVGFEIPVTGDAEAVAQLIAEFADDVEFVIKVEEPEEEEEEVLDEAEHSKAKAVIELARDIEADLRNEINASDIELVDTDYADGETIKFHIEGDLDTIKTIEASLADTYPEKAFLTIESTEVVESEELDEKKDEHDDEWGHKDEEDSREARKRQRQERRQGREQKRQQFDEGKLEIEQSEDGTLNLTHFPDQEVEVEVAIDDIEDQINSIYESYMSELQKVAIPDLTKEGVLTGGGKIKVDTKSPVLANGGEDIDEAHPIETKRDDHVGFEREKAPKVAPNPIKSTNEISSVKDMAKPVKKDSKALMNKDHGKENSLSPLSKK